MIQHSPPEPTGSDWTSWSRRLVNHLSQTRSKLVQQTGGESAADDGTIMWDRINKYPVVSKDGEWRQILLSDGQYDGAITTDVTAAAPSTAYPLTFTANTADGIANGTPASRIVFDEPGHYMASFSAQISSNSSSTVSFYFWPKLNGVDAPNSTMVASLHRNNATTVVSRSTTFNVAAGDYLEAYWAVSDVDGYLQATPATAFSPAAPAVTIGISRIYG